jgi:hypothetical protein
LHRTQPAAAGRRRSKSWIRKRGQARLRRTGPLTGGTRNSWTAWHGADKTEIVDLLEGAFGPLPQLEFPGINLSKRTKENEVFTIGPYHLVSRSGISTLFALGQSRDFRRSRTFCAIQYQFQALSEPAVVAVKHNGRSLPVIWEHRRIKSRNPVVNRIERRPFSRLREDGLLLHDEAECIVADRGQQDPWRTSCRLTDQRDQAPTGPWLDRLDARAPKNVVVVAMANKLARIAWVVLSSGEDYRPSVTVA